MTLTFPVTNRTPPTVDSILFQREGLHCCRIFTPAVSVGRAGDGRESALAVLLEELLIAFRVRLVTEPLQLTVVSHRFFDFLRVCL